jgi:hypothetical protein
MYWYKLQIKRHYKKEQVGRSFPMFEARWEHQDFPKFGNQVPGIVEPHGHSDDREKPKPQTSPLLIPELDVCLLSNEISLLKTFGAVFRTSVYLHSL